MGGGGVGARGVTYTGAGEEEVEGREVGEEVWVREVGEATEDKGRDFGGGGGIGGGATSISVDSTDLHKNN